MIKVFTVNGNGKIEFTKAELEKSLNDTYAEGQKNCNCGKGGITWANPYITPYCNTITACDANPNPAGTNNPASANTIKINLNQGDVEKASKFIDDIVKRVSNLTSEKNDAFSKLAKELTF